MKKMRYIELALAGIALALLSCSDDRDSDSAFGFPKGVPAVMDVTLPYTEGPLTRRNVDATTDNWTTKSFSANDRIGLLATGGLVGANGESEWLKNEYMDYYQATGSSNYRFRNDNLLINTGMMGGHVGKYVYFPYTDEMPIPLFDKSAATTTSDGHVYYYADPNNPTKYIDPEFRDKKGLLLRTKGTDGIERCIDYMYISSISLTNGALGGGFYHGFCEMIILRGEGFDEVPEKFKNDPKKLEIWVVLNSAFTRLTLSLFLNNNTGDYSWRPRNYFVATDGKTQEEAKRWQAWKGVDYIDSNDGEPVPREAYYAIMPSAHSYSYPSVDYIEIYNNDGELCRVSNFELYVNPETELADKQMRPGKRYALEIMMVETGAVVRPHEIEDWNEGVDDENNITDIRTVGIGSYDELEKWASLYDRFIDDVNLNPISRPKTEAEVKENALSQYGDYDLSNKVWKFYITDNITLPANVDVGIKELQDILEGASQLYNYSISNLRRRLIGTISPTGALRNIDFDNLYIKPKPADIYNETAGALTNRLNGGTIENCNINDGTMIGTSACTIGMLCGTVENNSTVRDCTVSGAMIGTTYVDADNRYAEGLFGNTAAMFTYTNNDAEDLIIKSN